MHVGVFEGTYDNGIAREKLQKTRTGNSVAHIPAKPRRMNHF